MCKLRNKIKENESPILVTLSLKFVTLSLLILHAVQKLILLFLLCSSLFFTQILPKLIYSPHNFTILTWYQSSKLLTSLNSAKSILFFCSSSSIHSVFQLLCFPDTLFSSVLVSKSFVLFILLSEYLQ